MDDRYKSDGIEPGDRFGRWTVLGFDHESLEPNKWRDRKYICLCECGTQRSVKQSYLKTKLSKSCGCRGRRMHKISPGDKFTRWTVLEEVERRDGKRVMRCQCSCGWIGLVRLCDLVGKISRSCGCFRADEQRERIRRDLGKRSTRLKCYMDFDDMSGQRFGRWTVIKRAQDNLSGNTAYLCRCDCGSEEVRGGRDLRCGRTRSCGCLRTERIRNFNSSGGNRQKRREEEGERSNDVLSALG